MNLTPRESIIFLKSTHLKATRQFYEEDCGLPMVLDQGTCQIFRLTATSFIGFCLSEEEPPFPERTTITIVTAEVDAWYERLHAKGVWTDGKPRTNERYQIFHFYARDPNGYAVEVQEFLDPRWSQALG